MVMFLLEQMFLLAEFKLVQPILKGWDWSSSYHYSDSIVKGFCHLNVSGTGMSDLGELTIIPATGKLKTGAGDTK